MTAFARSPGHHLTLLKGSERFFPALVQDIEQARHEVRIETYILDLHGSTLDLVQVLLRAARRGVSVQLLVDGLGTQGVGRPAREAFAAAGVRYQVYSPINPWGLFSPRAWRRLHRKLCLIDARVGYCGGINLLDDYHDPHHGALALPRWDFCVRVTGPLVQDMHQALQQLWRRVHAADQAREHDFGGAWQALHDSPLVSPEPNGDRLAGQPRQGLIDQEGGPSPSSRAALLLRDNLSNRTRIERAYRKAIGEARREVIIANAYFLPGSKMRQALREAARRGVRVVLLLQGRYEYFMQYHAARPVYGMLLAAGVEIHEYAPSFLHAKVAVIDGFWATVGSSNLDPLSILLAREANLVVEDRVFANQLRSEIIEAIASGGVKVDPRRYADRPLLSRLLDRIAYGLMRLGVLLARRRY